MLERKVVVVGFLFGDVFEFFVYFVPVDYVPVCFDEFGSVVFVVDVVCVFEYVY